MKIKFKFNAKSRGQGVSEALNLAEKCGGLLEDKFYIVEYEDPRNKNLVKLFKLVGRLKGSVISIDNGEPINASKFFYAIYCQDKLLCKGVCKHVRLQYYSVEEFALAYSHDIDGEILRISNTNFFRTISEFLDAIDDTHFKFNKQLFLEHANIELETERLLCDKFDFEKFTDYVNKLPSEIELISSEELEDVSEEKFEQDQGIAYILSGCYIDNKLPFETIIRCSKAISLMSRFKPSRISDTDIKLYSYPELNQVIFVKLTVAEYDSSSEEPNDELETFTITEKQGFFTVKSDYFELYFQIFEESDPSIKDHFKKLEEL